MLGEGAGGGERDLASGTYGYTVYATPTCRTTGAPDFSDSALVHKNIIETGTFTIP